MTSTKELKAIARQSLNGNWKFSITTVLIIFLINSILNLIPILGDLVLLVISPALSFVPLLFFLKIKRNEAVSIGEFFSAIWSNTFTYWGISLRTFLKLLPMWLTTSIGLLLCSSTSMMSILERSQAIANNTIEPVTTNYSSIISIIGLLIFIIGSIWLAISSLHYVLAIYIKHDNSDISCKEAVLKSKELMNTHKLEYVILAFSFIGWAILGIITIGIGILYFLPYLYTTFGAFYDKIIDNNTEINDNNVIEIN